MEILLCLTSSGELQLSNFQLQKQIQSDRTLTTAGKTWCSPVQHERKTPFKPFWVSLVLSHRSMLPEFLFPAGAGRDGGRHLLMHLGKIIESTISQHHETPRSQQLILDTSNPQDFLEKLLGRGFAQPPLLFGGLQHFGKLPSFWGTGQCWSTPEFCPRSSKRW